jgi:hypothetical protein
MLCKAKQIIFEKMSILSSKRHIYFVLDSLEFSENPLSGKIPFSFPIDFTQTTYPKTIILINAKHFAFSEIEGGVESKGVSVHSDIIQDDIFDDSFLCFCNESYYGRKLKIYNARTDFTFWLKGMMGQPIVLGPNNGRLVLELLLEF